MNVLKKVQFVLLVITLNFFFVFSSYGNKSDCYLAFFQKDNKVAETGISAGGAGDLLLGDSAEGSRMKWL